MPFQSWFNNFPAAVATSCGVYDLNATNGFATDPGVKPRADVQTQREPLASITQKKLSLIYAPSYF